jgi:hypothetical protein
MNQKLILENWRKYLKEEVDEIEKLKQQTSQEIKSDTTVKPEPTEDEKRQAIEDVALEAVKHALADAVATVKKGTGSIADFKLDLQNSINNIVKEQQQTVKAEEGSTKGLYNAHINSGIHTYEDLNKAIG